MSKKVKWAVYVPNYEIKNAWTIRGVFSEKREAIHFVKSEHDDEEWVIEPFVMGD